MFCIVYIFLGMTVFTTIIEIVRWKLNLLCNAN